MIILLLPGASYTNAITTYFERPVVWHIQQHEHCLLELRQNSTARTRSCPTAAAACVLHRYRNRKFMINTAAVQVDVDLGIVLDSPGRTSTWRNGRPR